MKKPILIVMALILIFLMAPASVSAEEQPGKVKISNTKLIDGNTVKISWKSAQNARKYQVFYSDSRNGDYTQLKTTKLKSFTGEELENGTYYFKIRAVNDDDTGSFSTPKGIEIHKHEWVCDRTEPSEVTVTYEQEVPVCDCGRKNPSEKHITDHIEKGEAHNITLKKISGKETFTEERCTVLKCECGETKLADDHHEWEPVYTTEKYFEYEEDTVFGIWCKNCGENISSDANAHMRANYKQGCTDFTIGKKALIEKIPKNRKVLSHFECSCGNMSNPKGEHVHVWEEVYKTVKEQVGEEPYRVSVCNACGAEDSSIEHRKAHALAGEPSGFHSETRYRPIYEETRVFSHYECECGEVKE